MLPEQDEFIEGLHRKYFKKLTLYAVSALEDSDRAQDVVQDAFHEAVLQIDTLMTHENPGGWLMQTVKYKVRNSERSRQRYIRRFFSLDTDIAGELVPSGAPAIGPQAQDEVLTLEKVAQALMPEEYQLLKRLTLDKASHLQVAQEFGITVYASQKRLERIRKKLYERFPEYKQKK